MSDKKLTEAQRALLSEKAKKFDESASKTDCIEDLRRLQNLHSLTHISRNFYRINGTYSDSTWNRYFGTFLEFRRQAGLELYRDQHALERQIAKHASVDIYRNFFKEHVLPYHQKYAFNERQRGRFKTILVGSDFHDIEVDEFVLSVFLDTAKRVQPDIIVLNGDVLDMYEFSSFTQDPRHFKIKERFDFVRKRIFKPLRELCPKSQITLITGNHELRFLKILSIQSPALRVVLSDVMGLTLADVFGLDEYEIDLVAKLDLSVFNASDAKKSLRENFKVFYNSFVCSHFKDWRFGMSGTSGHTHSPHMDINASIPMGKLTWVTTGCIANTQAEYIYGMDRWMNSFMLAHVDTETKLVIPEHFLIPGDHAMVLGKLYTRK